MEDDMDFEGFDSVWQRVMRHDGSERERNEPKPDKSPSLCVIKARPQSRAIRWL